MIPLDLSAGQAVVVHLQNPKEKVWGILGSVQTAGIVVRGLDVAAFDDWMREEAHGDESLVGPLTLFYPLHRVERLEVDETVGPVVSYSERFAREVGRTVRQVLGLDPDRR